ncbi:uncharacterized protein At5g39570 [Camellia sinensis]|uniref:Uncharacterized protein n=1 Tax=Camellia sinensis var. sinensis TaxID=542762 RepID=A0A4S4EQ08_CAMSN|nr:uncharacterized protein At5g39570 [Camellia sinensis]THG18829.1 hypothetical protein TEA_017468 [Camellia sinensis var. sinensis]
MAYYSSNFYKGDAGEYHSNPPYCTTSYDIVPFQNSISYSNYEFSEPRLSEYNLSAYYVGAYDPFPIPSEINYSTYNPIPYNTNYFSSNTQYTISYSTSTALDDIEFEEYDPTPYGGGYDPTLTYGKPLPPSDEICHPRSLPEPNGVSSDNFSYASIPSPYGNGDIDEQSAQPPKKTKPTEEQPQPNGGTGDNGHDTGHPEKLPDSSLGECYPWSGYGYGVTNEDYVPQAPCGYGLDGMDMCESIFGYWPCLDRINRKNCGHQGIEVGQENQWEGAVEYLFGSPYRHGGDEDGDYGVPICNYGRHHQEQQHYRQVVEGDENSLFQNFRLF